MKKIENLEISEATADCVHYGVIHEIDEKYELIESKTEVKERKFRYVVELTSSCENQCKKVKNS